MTTSSLATRRWSHISLTPSSPESTCRPEPLASDQLEMAAFFTPASGGPGVRESSRCALIHTTRCRLRSDVQRRKFRAAAP